MKFIRHIENVLDEQIYDDVSPKIILLENKDLIFYKENSITIKHNVHDSAICSIDCFYKKIKFNDSFYDSLNEVQGLDDGGIMKIFLDDNEEQQIQFNINPADSRISEIDLTQIKWEKVKSISFGYDDFYIDIIVNIKGDVSNVNFTNCFTGEFNSITLNLYDSYKYDYKNLINSCPSQTIVNYL